MQSGHGQSVLDRPRVVPVLLVAEVQPAARDPQLAVARDPRREHRVEQVDAPVDGVEEVERRAEAHQVARPRVAVEERDRRVERRVALVRRLVAGEAADVDAVERQAGDEPRRLRAQLGVEAALDDPEQRLVGARVRGERALRPAMGPVASRPRRPRAASSGTPAGRRRPRRPAPSACWTAIECSGVNRWIDPSRWLLNVTPSSSITRRSPSDTTWNPPESVRIGRSQPMNPCSPPRRSMRSWPGRRYRW